MRRVGLVGQVGRVTVDAVSARMPGAEVSITPELVQYQYVLKLAPGVQTIFIPSGNQFILPLPNTEQIPQ